MQESGSSFPEAFNLWSLWNYFTGIRADQQKYYPEGSAFPLIVQVPVGYAPPSRVITDSLRSLSARYYQILLPSDTLTVVIANANFSAATSGGIQYHPYTLRISSTMEDPGYQETGAGVYVKLDVSDPVAWGTWFLTDGSIIGPEPPALEEGTPFPNPFLADGSRECYLPLDAASGTEGDLHVYSSNMDLVYSARTTSRAILGRQAFAWNGITLDGQIAASGVYVVVITLPNKTLTSKVALLRQ